MVCHPPYFTTHPLHLHKVQVQLCALSTAHLLCDILQLVGDSDGRKEEEVELLMDHQQWPQAPLIGICNLSLSINFYL